MKARFFGLCSAFFSVLLLSAVVSGAAYAADREVSEPYVTKGKVKLQSRSEYVIDDSSTKDGSFEQIFEAGYGFMDRLYLEAFTTYVDKPHKDAELKNVGVEAKVQLTEKGQYFVDVGAKVEYKHNTAGDADSVKGKILFAKEFTKFANLANVELEREVGAGSSDREKFKMSFQTKYQFSPYFQPGLEYYGNFEDTTKDYEDQEHVVGPVIFGKFAEKVGYEAGVLFGLSEASPDATLKLNLNYKF